MRRVKQQKNTRIMKVVLHLLVLGFLSVLGAEAQTTTYNKAESFLFSFKEDNDMFLADYGDNAYQLERMAQHLQVSRKQLLDGGYHLLIVSHVGAYNYENEEVVNEASLRANRIRAYIKMRFDIPHESVAFYIDRSGNYRDQVHLYLVHKPLPWFANTSIRYSESRYPKAIKDALNKYGAVPYVDLFRRGELKGYEREVYRIDDPLFDRSELEDYRLASVVETVGRSGEAADPPVYQATVTTHEAVRIVQREEPVPEDKKPAKPIPVKQAAAIKKPVETYEIPVTPVHLAIKSNLLPWCTVAPSVHLGTGETKIRTGSFMPNLEVECFYAERWSVVLGGLYSDFSYNDRQRDKWSVSKVSLESRVWLVPGKFSGLNTGLFAEYGDFDVRGSDVDPDKDILYGRTGRFWSAGASVGYLVPLGAGFSAEASLQAGFRSVFDGKKYRYDKLDDRNYLETHFSSTGFMLGLKVSIAYRFQIR